MKAIVNVSEVKVYVSDLEEGDLVYVRSNDLSLDLCKISRFFDGSTKCVVTFEQKVRVRVGRKWWGRGQYEMRPMTRTWDPDKIVTVERRVRIPV